MEVHCDWGVVGLGVAGYWFGLDVEEWGVGVVWGCVMRGHCPYRCVFEGGGEDWGVFFEGCLGVGCEHDGVVGRMRKSVAEVDIWFLYVVLRWVCCM